MKILAIDTTALVSSVALVDETKVIAELTTNFKKTHSETLMPMIEHLKNMIGLELSEIDYIACASGPGSFTGLRIGVSAAKGLARGINKKIVPVPTLDALAYNIFESQKVIVPIMDARRNQVYAAIYRWENGILVKIEDYFAEDISIVVERANKYSEGCVFLGDGTLVHKDYILQNSNNPLFAPSHINMQLASAVGSLASLRLDEAIDFREVIPFYLRQSQAERERNDNN